jgi:hypothetical protein
MLAAESSRARQAALVLHGLSDGMRRRVLERLDGGERSRLQPLLDELGELGVPTSLGQSLAPEPDAESDASVAARSLHERVAHLAPEDVALALQTCAPSTAAYLVSAADWPWRESVLERLPPLVSKAVAAHRANTFQLAPAVLDVLCERLLESANAQSSSRSEPLLLDRFADDRPRMASRETWAGRLKGWLQWMR